jgi:glycerol-3-phosphate dehydrogenase (NAD(P)+)
MQKMTVSKANRRITVLGAGNFGTCLAQLFASKGYDVLLWGIIEEATRQINRFHRNPECLSEYVLSDRIQATSDVRAEYTQDADAVVLALPTQVLREVLRAWYGKLSETPLLICAAKGIENETLSLPISIISTVLGKPFGDGSVVLSGPSFAVEIMEGQPTCVSLAGHNPARCLAAQEMCHTPLFRCYTSDDPVGLEIAGALKNVIAIAAGAASGMGYMENSRAALLTRGLAEMARIGQALGANPLTFNGLGGVGDLFLTCTSQKSRNFTVGYRLGKGDKLDDIVATVGSVAEGVTTARAAFELVRKHKVDAPIISEVYAVLYQNKDIHDTIHDLLNRDPKPEIT